MQPLSDAHSRPMARGRAAENEWSFEEYVIG